MSKLRNQFSLQPTALIAVIIGLALIGQPPVIEAQSVCLPSPRLLTMTPMGGQAGTELTVTISGENLDAVQELVFSDSRIQAQSKLDEGGKSVANTYVVKIAADCPTGVYEARVMSRLGLSSSRVFSVNRLPEFIRTAANTALGSAMELGLNTICNASVTARSIDFYSFQAKKAQRIVVDCATRGIDSKLDAVLMIADAQGRDLLVERRGGILDFTVPDDGKYVVKVHDLTFKGGPEQFYRLALLEQPVGSEVVRMPTTKEVNSFSWPPAGLASQAELKEVEPNNVASMAQMISLPCDVSGQFFPAADIDVFQFEAKKGEEWWIEVGSERLGLSTDPAILVQHVAVTADGEKVTDVAEFNDIPSPVKVSSNGYAYDGPPYNAGSADLIGKLVIKEDGLHRLQITDLFGGTRKDPRNVYRLIIRKAAPDFAVVAWAMHMELRNGDRNALSKPMTLRGGATMAMEVVVVRRDGFDGEINLDVEQLPEGVTAKGLKIPSGQSRGLVLLTAEQSAPRGWKNATIFARATINGTEVKHSCPLASFAWPIPDSWGEIPFPRLMMDVPVSVGGVDMAPISIASTTFPVVEAKAGEKVVIPLAHVRRSEFSGATMELKTMGAGFESAKPFNISITSDQSQIEFDLAALKVPAGDHVIALYGSAVAKYRHNPDLVTSAEEAHRQIEKQLQGLETEVKAADEQLKTASAEQKEEAEKSLQALMARQKATTAALAAATEQIKQATATAQPRDIVDIVVSQPISIRIMPAESK